MTTYLVTGGAGFIGSNLCEALVMAGERVRILDDLSTGKLSNCRTIEREIEFIEGHVEDEATSTRAVRGADIVVHLAAIPSVVRSIEDPVATERSNVLGTLRILLAARDAGVKRFVLASSSAVYGNSKKLPKVERMLPAPASPYALSKLAGEYYCSIFSRLYGLPTVSLRFFNIFGPRQDPSSPYSGVISVFVDRMLRGERPTIYGDGEQSRDFVYVDNAVAAIRAGCSMEGAMGQTINIGSGTRRTLNELHAALCTITGHDQAPLYADPRPGEVRHSQADISLARKLMGYQPLVGFEQGLNSTVQSMR